MHPPIDPGRAIVMAALILAMAYMLNPPRTLVYQVHAAPPEPKA